MNLTQMTVSQVATILNQKNVAAEVIMQLESDTRVTVKRLLAKWHRHRQSENEELQRLNQLYTYEQFYYEQGLGLVAGVDEAGRGPLAGPVVVAAVILPPNHYMPSLNDSKKLSSHQRQILYQQIQTEALAVSSWFVDEQQIDRINIYQATVVGMYAAIQALKLSPHAVLIDAMPLPNLAMPNQSIINGDALSASIAAASIIAKVERDRFMDNLDKKYPGYGFAKHKGYATPEHLSSIRNLGPCPAHRRSFEPIKSLGG